VAERLDQSEESNKQLEGQVNFLSKTNESLMKEIDDSNERMSAELASCRQGKEKAETRCTVLPPACHTRDKAEARCTQLETDCQQLSDSVQLMSQRTRGLERSVEEAQRAASECERLRHEHSVQVTGPDTEWIWTTHGVITHSVLVASEEKLVDKMNDKDDLLRRLMGEQQLYQRDADLTTATHSSLAEWVLRRLMGELAECRTALGEQSHKLELSNMALDASRQQAAGGARQIEETTAHQRQLDDAQRELTARVRELEKSEAVLATRLAGVEADKDQLSGTESVPAVTFPAADTHTGGQRSAE